MRGILADINVIAQCDALLAIWTSATWAELWVADRLYAESVAERLLEKLIAIDDFRGAGRIYVP